MRRTLPITVVVLLLTAWGTTHAVRAENAPKPEHPPTSRVESIDLGTFTESGTRRFNYFETYTVVHARLGRAPLRVELDYFDNPVGTRRLWLNYGQWNLAGGARFRATFAPGMLFINDGRTFYGGFLTLSAPRLGLSVTQMSFAGNRKDRNYTFSSLRITDHVSLMHYLYMQHAYTPDSYLGPAFSAGHFYAWGGISLVRPGAWSTNLQATFRL